LVEVYEESRKHTKEKEMKKYSKETTDDINEFFRLLTITMAELKETVKMGAGYKKMCMDDNRTETAEEIQGDMDEIEVIIAKAKQYSEHLEMLIGDCVEEIIVKRRMTVLTMRLRTFLMDSVKIVEKRLKDAGILVVPISKEALDKIMKETKIMTKKDEPHRRF
jgi:hypothetical protein